MLNMFQKIKNWRSIKVNYIKVRQSQMVLALIASVAGYQIYHIKFVEEPSAMIPAQSFERYVKIQKEAKREI